MSKGGKNNKPARRQPGSSSGGAALMQQMGFQMPNLGDPGNGIDDDDDDDLEAELRRLQQDSGGPSSKRVKANQRKQGGQNQDLQSFHNDVNKLLSDIDRPINDDELSDVDEDELLAELHEIADVFENEQRPQHGGHNAVSQQPISSGNMLSLLEARQQMYSKALATAKSSGDAAKTRRLDRQLKSIQELLQSARTGAPIDESAIPPELFVAPTSSAQTTPAPVSEQIPVRAPSPPRPQQAAPQPRVVPLPQPPARSAEKPVTTRAPAPALNEADSAIERLKSLAVQAKREGNLDKAREYLIKIKALQNETTSARPVPAAAAPPPHPEAYDNVPEDDGLPPPPMPLKAPVPRSVLEALQQRLDELNKKGEEAATKGETAKARRLERLAQQHKEAIDATRKGRPFDYSELADLPGFAPIPFEQAKPQPQPAAAPARPAASTAQVRPTQPQQHRSSVTSDAGPAAAAAAPISARKNQQAQTLRIKQEKFHKLAVEAKKQGDLDSAKRFLLAYKGLDNMIVAAESGLPVDMSQIPKLPDDDYEMINDDDITAQLVQADRETIYHQLQEDLLRQIQLCARNQQIYAQMEGPIHLQHANEYKTLEQRCAHDLERLRQCFQHGLKPPLFHYERRQMNVVQVNNDLGENDLEVTVLRGINLPVPVGFSPNSMETYVNIEFPYPTETPQTGRTRHAVGSTNAEYPDAQFKFYIKRNDAKFKRLMNRKELKLAVSYKAGFLRSDRPLGTASIKLAALEQTCTIHESVDLFESEHRKKIEGKLEVKLRIKEAWGPTKTSEILPQRWLVIDRFEDIPPSRKPSTNKSSSAGAPPPPISALARLVPTGETFSQLAINLARNRDDDDETEPSEGSSRSNVVESSSHHRRNHRQSTNAGPQSVQVLNYEASLLQQQIEQLHDRLTPEQLHQLQTKHKTITDQSERLVDTLRMGGKQAVNDHVQGLEELIGQYDREAQEYHERHDSKKADILLKKKSLVIKEINTLTGQPPSTTRTRV